jgi:hypothetical protein
MVDDAPDGATLTVRGSPFLGAFLVEGTPPENYHPTRRRQGAYDS